MLVKHQWSVEQKKIIRKYKEIGVAVGTGNALNPSLRCQGKLPVILPEKKRLIAVLPSGEMVSACSKGIKFIR